MSKTATEAPPKVLFVDDEENILRSLRRLFLEEDFEVFTSSSGEKALELLKDHRDVALIVSDQRMPGLSGVEFLERTKEIAPDALRIVLTGYADMNATIDAINRGGAYRYVTKPWQDDDLIQTIKDGVQRFSLVAENKRLTELVQKQNQELKDWNAQLEYEVQKQTIEIQKQNHALQELNKRLKNNFRNTIVAFSNLLELRDQGSESHSRNVAEISVKTARAMKLSDEEIESITVASLLHDIGKIGISDALLKKPLNEMTSEEQAEYMLHAVRGQTAVDSIEDLRKAGILIRHHHEWYNGMGIPDGLSGEKEIPIGSRIIAMADFIDRIVRKSDEEGALPLALHSVKKELGRRFDPQLYSFVETSAKEVCRKLLPTADVIEQEFHPNNLQVGMTLAQDVRSGTGLLLLRKGTRLDGKSIEGLCRYYQLDPSRRGVFVWLKK